MALDLQAMYDVAIPMALVGPAFAALVLGVTADTVVKRVGFVAIGVFGLLTAITPQLAVATAGVVVAGGILILAPQIRDESRWDSAIPTIVAIAIMLGVTFSVGATTGLLPVRFRAIGSICAFIGVAGIPVLVRPTTIAWVGGGVTAVAIVAAAITAPFVTGAVALVVSGSIGAPLLLLALGIAGAVTTVLTGLTRTAAAPTIGGLLILTGGSPATVPRAITILVGLTFVLNAGILGGDTT